MTEVLPTGGAAQYAWLLVALPACGALVLLAGGRRTNRWGHLLGCATVLVSFVYGVVLFSEWLGLGAEERTRELSLGTWFAVNSLSVDYGLRLDPLSLTFVLLITGVGGLIHLYSIGYMGHDPGRRRFFGYFNRFTSPAILFATSPAMMHDCTSAVNARPRSADPAVNACTCSSANSVPRSHPASEN
jgi:NADH-quinone oxidoreductase subunit L